MFNHVTVLVAVNDGKQPSRTTAARARGIRGMLPVGWGNVAVAAWHGLTVDYCRRHGCGVIVRGVRNPTDGLREYELAAMNEALGVTTLFVPAQPELATMSSTAMRTLGLSAQVGHPTDAEMAPHSRGEADPRTAGAPPESLPSSL